MALAAHDFAFIYGRLGRERLRSVTIRPGSIPGRIESYLAEFLDDLPLRHDRRTALHSFGGDEYDTSAWRRRRRRSRDPRRDSVRAPLFRRRRGSRGGAEAARVGARAVRDVAGALQRAAGSGPTEPRERARRAYGAGAARVPPLCHIC